MMAAGLLMISASIGLADSPLHKKISVDFRDFPLADALQDLEQKAGVSFQVDQSFVAKQSPVTLAMNDVAAGRVATRLLRPVHLTMANTDGSSIRVVPRPLSDIFSVSREESFEFVRKPTLTLEGDKVTIAFETKEWCDVTVAIEDTSGNILRHLASGVLGPSAPRPFQWNSKSQTLVWDGKDDRGKYVDDKDRVRVRVALGLKPRFERTLYWHPAKRSGDVWALASGKEGIFVFNSGRGIDQVRLFDREGNYVRAVYPFPAEKVEEMQGLIRHKFPDGPEIPIKPNWLQTTLLMSGDNCFTPTYRGDAYKGHQSKTIANGGMDGTAARGIAVADGKVALIGHRFSRFTTAGGGVGRLSVHGRDIAFRSDKALWKGSHEHKGAAIKHASPRRGAISPDGKWLYLTMYNETFAGHGGVTLWRHQVKRTRFDADGDVKQFAGKVESGSADGEFNMPADVACDARGRVYVADHHNDRIQVFDPDGKHLKTMKVRRPVLLDVDPKTGEIYVFSWALPLPSANKFWGTRPSIDGKEKQTYFRLTRLPSFGGKGKQESWDLQKVTGLERTRASNVEIQATVDFGSDPVRVWITAPSPVGSRRSRGRGLVVLALENGKWQVKRDLLAEAKRAVVRTGPGRHNRQRLTVNPANGNLYLFEGDTAWGKAFQRALQIDPRSGRVRNINLPMSSEDMAFDQHGHVYLRSSEMVVRYRADTWREVPFDYGEERKAYHFGGGGGERSGRVISGAMFPGRSGFHLGGMHVNARGEIVVSTIYSSTLDSHRGGERIETEKNYQPHIYPGRHYTPGGRMGGTLVHLLNRYGKMIDDDVIPGLPGWAGAHGTFIDSRGDIYIVAAAPAMIRGKRHFNDHAGTLMKFTPATARLRTTSGTPVPMHQKPERPHDLYMSQTWVENAHWIQPGVGFGSSYSTACACWNNRSAFDYYARTFTPEVDRYSVGVLDSAGNIMARIGQYGNVDDGVPLVQGRDVPPNTRSIGGDETAFMHAPYLAVHTDNRLFAADPGNARVVSVKLGYHTEETVALKDVQDGER